MIIQFGVHIMESYFPYEPRMKIESPEKENDRQISKWKFLFRTFSSEGVPISFIVYKL